MAMQFSVAARNGWLDAIEAELGSSPILKIWSGAQPANCAAADAGTALATLSLPADALANAASGVKAKSGTWSGTAAASGTAVHFRIYKSDGTTCVIQGSCGIGTGDMQIDNTSLAISQAFTVTAFQLTAGNA
jgi:hypothetical protein